MEAIHIRCEPCDILMNGRGKWCINIIPQLASTQDGQMVDFSEQRNGKHKASNSSTPDEQPKSDEEFDQQYTQRSKRQRLREQEGQGQGKGAGGQGQSREVSAARSNPEKANDRKEVHHMSKTSLKRKAST